MIYFCYFLIGLLLIRWLVACVNYLSFAYLPKETTLTKWPSISILIPARNEEENIGVLLEQLSKLDYPKLEIIVCNDHSTDGTEKTIKHWTTLHPNMVLLNGVPLPKDWLGKNFACHQLAQVATGDLLLFLDADVSISPSIIKRSIAHFQKHKLRLLSIFPKQVFETLGEKVTVPLMNWILLSLLPLMLIRRSKNQAFSAANGQFMLFDAATYKTLLPHQKCKFHKVEDIAIIRYFKQKELACDTRLGDDAISCRMYKGFGEAVEGFTKNIFEFFGNNILVTLAFGLLISIAPFVVFYTMGLQWVITYVTGVLSLRIFVSLASQQSVLQNLVLALPQHLVFLIIIGKGLINIKQKKLLWKGRNILQD